MYPSWTDGIERAKLIPLEDLRNTKDKQGDNRLIFIQTYNPITPEIFKIMDKGKHILNGSEKLKPIVNRKWTKGQRQAPNLKQILTRAKFTTSEEYVAMRSSRPRCRTCPIFKETKELIFTNAREKFDIRTKMDCTSHNLVYCIKCNGCGKDYIGQMEIN